LRQRSKGIFGNAVLPADSSDGLLSRVGLFQNLDDLRSGMRGGLHAILLLRGS
jgi:hypothetical protein